MIVTIIVIILIILIIIINANNNNNLSNNKKIKLYRYYNQQYILNTEINSWYYMFDRWKSQLIISTIYRPFSVKNIEKKNKQKQPL